MVTIIVVCLGLLGLLQLIILSQTGALSGPVLALMLVGILALSLFARYRDPRETLRPPSYGFRSDRLNDPDLRPLMQRTRRRPHR